MKLKLLLLFLCIVGYGFLADAQTKFDPWASAQTRKPYNNLIITEVSMGGTPQNYTEVTNMGTETLDLSQFELGTIGPWTTAFNSDPNNHFRLWDPTMYPMNSPLLQKRYLAPGKSFVIAIGDDFGPEMWFKDPLHYPERSTKPEWYKLADLILHRKEQNSTKTDSITPKWNTMDTWGGRDCMYVRHFFKNETTGAKDSMLIDQAGGFFDNNGYNFDKAYDVAGVKGATNNSVLMRKNSIKAGINVFTSNADNVDAAKKQFPAAAGLDLNDSEWIPVPKLGPREEWRAVFWTAGNQVNAILDTKTLESKTGKVLVDLDKATISVPWGVAKDDSIMYQFKRKPGLAWKYDYATTVVDKNNPMASDSAFSSIRTGDKLTLYVIGDIATIKEFSLISLAPGADENRVMAMNGYDYRLKYFSRWVNPWQGMRISDGVKGMDTIKHIGFATRVDSLFKYLEKPAKATMKVVFNDGIERPDLKTGDKLRVTSESGKAKDYFIKLDKYLPSANDYLSAITWPDMPAYFRGAVAESPNYGWKGDTIPGFAPTKNNYVVKIPLEYQGIPALAFMKQHLDSKVVVTRAKTLAGTPADRTVTFTVTAENDTTVNVYTVRFEPEKDPANMQPFKGEPFFSEYIFWESWSNAFLEIANPGTEPLDLSHYMIAMGWGGPQDVFWYDTGVTNWSSAYSRYVPGKKWVSEAQWQVTPAVLEPDLATNAIVYPGDVFVIADIRTTAFNDKTHGNGDNEYRKEIDIDFKKNPWGRGVHDNTAIRCWNNASLYMWKILNDSVINGLKAATDPLDFELIESFGSGSAVATVKVGGVDEQMIQTNIRKPEIYKPNAAVGGSNGTTLANSEWTFKTQATLQKLNYGWPDQILRIAADIGFHNMNEVTVSKSTVTSKIYKVSPGYSMNETIKGLTTGTTVTGFYNNILKANALQTLTVKSAANGAVLADAAVISKGDNLIVLSADSVNTSKYILDVTATGLSANALLTSTKYTINVTGSTGTIAGFPQRTPLKTVFAGVVVPPGATLTITDVNDAYMSLTKLNYDTAYVNVIATDKIFFEVIAENGTTKILYQLKPTTSASDAFVISDVYSVDQFASLIQFVPVGTSVRSLLSNVTPATGATMVVFDKAGFVRTLGDVYKDDKLVVTSADGKTTKAYYFSMLNFNVNTYLAYVISDDYTIDQVNRIIKVPATGIAINEFFAKLYPSFGAKLTVIDKNGIASKLTKLASYDKLLVTAADNMTTAVYKIEFATATNPTIESAIKMYPNPTDGRVIVQGLATGNRVQVFNAAGITLRDVIVDNSTEYVSLAAQPAGIYVFVISSGDQHINIQKIVKK